MILQSYKKYLTAKSNYFNGHKIYLCIIKALNLSQQFQTCNIWRKQFLLLILINPLIDLQVLITKLRSANNVETQQYRKAAKALLVLIPLLGITYILFIVGPTEGQYAVIYSYIRALLLSTQVSLQSFFGTLNCKKHLLNKCLICIRQICSV